MATVRSKALLELAVRRGVPVVLFSGTLCSVLITTCMECTGPHYISLHVSVLTIPELSSFIKYKLAVGGVVPMHGTCHCYYCGFQACVI